MNTTKPTSSESLSSWLNRKNIKSYWSRWESEAASIYYKGTGAPNQFYNFVSGAIFGSSLAIGLGLTLVASISTSITVGIGTLIAGSLLRYLIIQILLSSLSAALLVVLIRSNYSITIESRTIQTTFLLLVLLAPLVSLIPKVGTALRSLKVPNSVQLVTAFTFAGFVYFLRQRMPSDPIYGLSKMYFGEDNSAIVASVSSSLETGITRNFSQFGEFVNLAYLAFAGLIDKVGTSGNPDLIPVLTHYNLTLLLMSVMPLVAMTIVALSGIRVGAKHFIAFMIIITGLLVVLFWPFVAIGHTSIIISGIFTTAMISLSINHELALKHPLFFTCLVFSFALVVGTSWFPLMPLSALVSLIAVLFLVKAEVEKGKFKILVFVVPVFIVLAIYLLPAVIDLIFTSGEYLQMDGGTRVPTHGLTITWLVLSAFLFWNLAARQGRLQTKARPALFLSVLTSIIGSGLYLAYSGIINNQGSIGYGASKYLLVAIASSLPIVWMLSVTTFRYSDLKQIMGSGLILLLIVGMIQPDTRRVPATILATSLGAFEFLEPVKPDSDQSRRLIIAKALGDALQSSPDNMFCISDVDPLTQNGEFGIETYLCSRWAQALTSEKTAAWRFAPLGRASSNDLNATLASVGNETVVVLRLINASDSMQASVDATDAWWRDYVHKSWVIITVPLPDSKNNQNGS